MDRNDQQAIENLFGKLAKVESQVPERDGDAERFIRDRINSQPGAPYYMAQTIVVQEQALGKAQQRIAQLEAQNVQSSEPAQPQRGGHVLLHVWQQRRARQNDWCIGCGASFSLGSTIQRTACATARRRWWWIPGWSRADSGGRCGRHDARQCPHGHVRRR